MATRWIVILDGSSNRGAATKEILTSNAFRMMSPFEFNGTITAKSEDNGEEKEQVVPQIVLYFSGVGTRGDTLSAATGRGFDDIIIEAYVALSSNFQDGDSIYIFGFSRGAAAAHAVTGLISDPGLLWADRLELFPLVWKYSNFAGGEAHRRAMRKQIGDGLFHPNVEFLGFFDAVLGQSWDVARLFVKARLQDLKLARCVNKAVHLLSIDDDRRVFSPLLWSGPSRADQVIEQIWMPGVHADVGGASEETLLGDISFLTMLNRLRKYCPELALFEEYIDDKLRPHIGNARVLAITSERSDVFRKVLRRQVRTIGKSANEYVHPIVGEMMGRTIVQRGRSAIYQPANYKDGLETADLGEDTEFMVNAVRRFLS